VSCNFKGAESAAAKRAWHRDGKEIRKSLFEFHFLSIIMPAYLRRAIPALKVSWCDRLKSSSNLFPTF
jgi:hypothetical protein